MYLTMIRFNMLLHLAPWTVVYYVFLFFHVYGNLFFLVYASVWGLMSLNQKRLILSIDFIFFLSFFGYVSW